MKKDRGTWLIGNFPKLVIPAEPQANAGISYQTGSGLPGRSIVGLSGLPAGYTLVLVDGVRLLTEHIHTGQNLDLIPPEMIERIEIIRGAASAQYGADAIGGVINIITRKCRDKSETSLAGAMGYYDTYEANATWLRPVDEHIGVSMLVNWEQSHGLPIKEPPHRAEKMGYKRLNVLTRVDVGFADSSNVFGWVHWVDNTMDWQDDDADSVLGTAVLGLSHPVHPSLNFFAQASYSKWDAEVSEEQNELLQPESFVTWNIHPAHTLTGGVDFKYNKFTRTAVKVSEQNTFGTFVQHEWRIDHPLTVMIALRLDCVEDLDPVLSPKASVLYSPHLPLRLRGSVARGFHAPTPQELYEEGYGHGGRAYRFGNPDLRPEYGTTFGLGLELFPGRAFQVALYGHYSDIDDMIVPVYEGPWEKDPTKDVWRRVNIEHARVYGGEVEARYTLSRNLRFEVGYSYTDNEDEDTGRQLPYNPGSSLFAKTVAGGHVAQRLKCSGFIGLRATFDREAWNWKPAGGAKTDDPSGLTTKLKDYQKLDAGISLIYGDTYQVFLNVYNIIGQDIEYLDDVYTVIDGEPNLRGGIRCRW